MTRRDSKKEALARAERLLDRAEKLCGEAAAVLCTAAVKCAEKKAWRAAALVEEAVKIARAPALARLGVRADAMWLEPRRFIDELKILAPPQFRQSETSPGAGGAELLSADEASTL